MKSKKTILLILIVLASLIPRVGALTPQEQTIHIADTYDDGFITEIGIKIDAALCHIKDPSMDIHAFLVFRELEINWWEPLENVTLRLRTSGSLTFEADSSVTIYGFKIAEVQDLGRITASDVSMIGYTSAYVNYNTSQFYGSQWHEIDVTEIVEELIRHPHWDGDGHAGIETGDAIGFHILGPEGNEKRYFIDKKLDNGQEAQIVIHWNHEPPPPTGYSDPTFNETYRGYHIWNTSIWMNYTDWNEIDAANKIDVINSSYVNLGTQFSYSTLANLRNDTRGPYSSGRWRFGVMISLVSDSVTGRTTNIQLHALGEPNYQAGFRSYSAADEYAIGFGVTDYDDQTNNKFYFAIQTYFEGTRYETFSASSYDANSSRWYWVEITYDCPTQFYEAEIYNDYEMTDLETTVTRGPGFVRMINTTYDYEFAIESQNYAYAGYHEGAVRSTPNLDTWIVTDENGTIIDEDLDDYEDAIDIIEDILGADPEDPDPPAEDWAETGPFTRFRTRFYFLIMGLFMLFGPLFTFAYRRPSGYAFVIGLFIMLVGFSFLIHVGSV